MVTPHYADESVTLYRGDCREVVPALSVTVDYLIARRMSQGVLDVEVGP